MKPLAAWQTYFYCCRDASCLVAIAVCHGTWCSKCQFTHSPRQSQRQILCLEYHSTLLQSQSSACSYTSKWLINVNVNAIFDFLISLWRYVLLHLLCKFAFHSFDFFLIEYHSSLLFFISVVLDSMLPEEHENKTVTVHSNQHRYTIHFIPPCIRVSKSCWM